MTTAVLHALLDTQLTLPTGESTVADDGSRVAISVLTLTELNDWYLAMRREPTFSGAVGMRTEERDGQLWNLGGLEWQIGVTLDTGVRLAVTTVTLEDESHPELAVSELWPHGT